MAKKRFPPIKPARKKPTFENLFDTAAAEFEAAFLRGATGQRPDEVGEARERHLRDFLRDWLPAQYGVSHGYIIDINGNQSKQSDVILYDADRCPKFLLDRNSDRRLVPFADVYGTIEVKSTLSEAEFLDALEKLESVDSLEVEPSGNYVTIRSQEECQVLAIEDEYSGSSWQWSTERVNVPESNWDRYRVKIIRRPERRTPPLTIIFAYRFDSSFSFARADAILQRTKHRPDGIFVLDVGFSLFLNEDAMRRYKSLSTGRPASEFDFDSDVMFANPRRRGWSAASAEYLTKEDVEPKVTLLHFYAHVMDLLSAQHLTESQTTDLLAVWRRP